MCDPELLYNTLCTPRTMVHCTCLEEAEEFLDTLKEYYASIVSCWDREDLEGRWSSRDTDMGFTLFTTDRDSGPDNHLMWGPLSSYRDQYDVIEYSEIGGQPDFEELSQSPDEFFGF